MEIEGLGGKYREVRGDAGLFLNHNTHYVPNFHPFLLDDSALRFLMACISFPRLLPTPAKGGLRASMNQKEARIFRKTTKAAQ